MSKSTLTPHRIVFRLAGDDLKTVIHWQQLMDLAVIGYQLETRGTATVLQYKHSNIRRLTFQDLKELPKPGEALPWYGDTGSLAYTFHFKSQGDVGSHLRVVHEAGGRGPEHFPPEKSPPLDLSLTDKMQIIPSHPDDAPSPYKYGPGWGWQYDWSEATGPQEIIFEVGVYLWPELVSIGWTGLNAETFTYIFNPTTVGMDIFLQPANSEADLIWLTREVGW